MADSKKLITKVNRLHNARQLIESISEPANTAYYMFIGNHLEYANTSDIPNRMTRCMRPMLMYIVI